MWRPVVKRYSPVVNYLFGTHYAESHALATLVSGIGPRTRADHGPGCRRVGKVPGITTGAVKCILHWVPIHCGLLRNANAEH